MDVTQLVTITLGTAVTFISLATCCGIYLRKRKQRLLANSTPVVVPQGVIMEPMRPIQSIQYVHPIPSVQYVPSQQYTNSPAYNPYACTYPPPYNPHGTGVGGPGYYASNA